MKNTETITHKRAEALLRKYGWSNIRQFQPNRDMRIGDEVFELWQSPSAETVFIHFYADGSGAEFYFRASNLNSWTPIEAELAELAKPRT